MSISLRSLKDQGFGEEDALEQLIHGMDDFDHNAAEALDEHVRICGGNRNSIFNRSVVDGKCVDKVACEREGGIFIPWNIDFQAGVYQFPQCYEYHENELHPNFYLKRSTQYIRIGYFQKIHKWCLEVFSTSTNPPQFSTFDRRKATGVLSFNAYNPKLRCSDNNDDRKWECDLSGPSSFTAPELSSYTVSLNTGSGNIPNLGGKTYNTRQITALLKEASEGNMRSFGIICGLIRGNLQRKYPSDPVANSIPLGLGQLVSGRQSLQHYIDNNLPLRDPRTQKDARIQLFENVACTADCGSGTFDAYIISLTNYTIDNEKLRNAAIDDFDELLDFWSPEKRAERQEEIRQADERFKRIREGADRTVREDPLTPSRLREEDIRPSEEVDSEMLSRISGDFAPKKKSNMLRNTALIGSALVGSVMYMRYRRNR